MKVLFLLFIFFTTGCSVDYKSNQDKKYSFTVSKLVEQQGQPQSKVTNEVDESFQMYNYQLESYQVQDQSVIARFRTPNIKEKNIQYWRHLFSEEYYKIENDNSSFQGVKLLKLIVINKGITVVYSKNNGQVLRIIESMRDDYVK